MTASELCSALVRIPTAQGESTAPVIALCAQVLAPAGFRLVEQVETAPGAWHGLLERAGEAPALLLDAHTDTVPVGERGNWQREPLGGEVAAGAVWGRGAADNKGPLAAALVALLAAPGRRRTLLSLTGDEEVQMRGMPAICEHPAVRQVSQALVLEPTGSVPLRAHKGNARIRVEVQGRAAHASRPWEGRSAIDDKMRLMRALAAWFAQGEGRRRVACFGQEPPTLVVTRESTPNPAYNVIPDRASFWYNYRPLPGRGEPFGRLVGVIQEQAARLGIQAQVEVEFAVPPLCCPAETPLVRTLERASGQAAGWAAYGTHAGFLAGRVREAAVMGPGHVAVAHRENEHILVADLEEGVRVLTAALEELLG